MSEPTPRDQRENTSTAIADVLAGGFRKLVFPEPLESGYRAFNAQRSAEMIRRIMPWVTPFWLVAAGVLAIGFGDVAGTWINNAMLPVGVAIAWLWMAMLTRWLEHDVHLHVGLALVVAQFATLRTVFLLGDDPFSLYVILQSIYLLVILFTLSRLPMPTALLCALLPGVAALATAGVEQLAIDWMKTLQFYGNTLMLGLVIGYVLEHRERAAWLTAQQRDREMQELSALRASADAASRRQQRLSEYLQLISGNPTPTEIAGRTLAFLIEHTGAQVGAIFVTTGSRLRRAAARGLDGETRLPEDLGRGETLIGQAAENRRRMRLFHLPDDYCSIRTATGSMRPAELLIEPVHSDGRTLAVIELGSLHRFSDEQVELVDHLAPTVAGALVAAMARDRLADVDFDEFAPMDASTTSGFML